MPDECPHCGSDTHCDCNERIKCDKVGTPGHLMCGYCTVHNQPRFTCGMKCAIKVTVK